jgi:hypothetical protein
MAVAALVAIAPAVGRTQEGCPTVTGTTLSRAAAGEHAQRVAAQLSDEATRARRWTIGWTIAYGALTAAQGIPAFFVGDKGLRADLVVGAATSAIGLLGVAVLPPEVLACHTSLTRELGDGTLADSCAAGLRADQLRAAAVDDEAFATGPVMHLANAVVNIAAGLVLGLGYDRWASGAITAASGIAVGELQILTAPTRLRDAPAGADATPTVAVTIMAVPSVRTTASGLALAVHF